VDNIAQRSQNLREPENAMSFGGVDDGGCGGFRATPAQLGELAVGNDRQIGPRIAVTGGSQAAS
jgi:hypothetical protein